MKEITDIVANVLMEWGWYDYLNPQMPPILFQNPKHLQWYALGVLAAEDAEREGDNVRE